MGSKVGLQQCLNAPGFLAQMEGKYDEALDLLRRQESLCEELSLPDGRANRLGPAVGQA